MELTKFQRQKLRHVVGVSTSLYDSVLAISDRRNVLRGQLNEAIRMHRRKKDEVQAIRSFADYASGMSPADRKKNLAVAQQMEDEYLEMQRELEHEIQKLQAQIEAVQADSNPAGRLAEALLQFAGVDRDHFQSVMVYTRAIGGAA